MQHCRLKLKHAAVMAASIHALFSAPGAWANPTGSQVVNGQVSTARPNASTLNVTNSPGAIINWQGFSIGAGETTRFIQQSASSAVLNRVVGPDISSIQGQLLSNGRVFLINPAGIVIGPNAVIDTAGFVGSTLSMLDADFLAGKLKFQGDASSGRIVNQGWIKAASGGQVILVAPQIENSGLIQAPNGQIILAAGKSVTIATLDHDGVRFEVQAPADSVINIGKLLAEGGAVGVFAGSLKHSGEIRATSLTADATGQIILKGSNEVTLTAGSITEANGPSGGRIEIQSGGTTLVSGTVEATGLLPYTSGIEGEGRGGSISVLGNLVGLTGNATLNASGYTGGGTVLVGGDFQGKNASVQNAFRTYVGPSTTIKADAITSGDGGKVIVWADDVTRYYGSISARGGSLSGNGGFVEVSGKGYLDYQGSTSISAPNGKGGTLQLDPTDITLVAEGGTLDDELSGSTDKDILFADGAANTMLSVTELTTGFTSGDTIQLQASNNITFGQTVALQSGVNLSLNAGNQIAITAPLSTTSGGNLALTSVNGSNISADVTTNALNATGAVRNPASPGPRSMPASRKVPGVIIWTWNSKFAMFLLPNRLLVSPGIAGTSITPSIRTPAIPG